MKPVFSVRGFLTLAVVCFMTLAAGIFAFRAQASGWDKRTILTVDQTIQIRNTVLQPGTYVLRLADNLADRHIVQIFDRDQTHIIDTVMAIPNERLQPTGDSRFLFWETPPGTAKALRAWFYPGDDFGQEFPYPKQLTQLASYRPAPSFTPAPPPPPQPEVVAPPTQPQAEVQPPPAEVQPSPQEERPVVIAQNNTPPPAVEEPPAPPPSPAPETLPKTASPYPLIGLGGLLSLGLYSFTKVKRAA
jgi:hypothetical protein